MRVIEDSQSAADFAQLFDWRWRNIARRMQDGERHQSLIGHAHVLLLKFALP